MIDWLKGPLADTACIVGAVDCAWFLRAFWIERIAKFLQFLSATVILVDIYGPARVDAFAERARSTLAQFNLRQSVQVATRIIQGIPQRIRHRPFDDDFYFSGRPLGCLVGLLYMLLFVFWFFALTGALSEMIREENFPGFLAPIIVLGGAFMIPWLTIMLLAYSIAIVTGVTVMLARAAFAPVGAVALFLLRHRRLSELVLLTSFGLLFLAFVIELLESYPRR
jgi:hypothetical protein